MSLVADDFAEFVGSDTGEKNDCPLGDSLMELAVNVGDEAERR